MTKQKAFLFDLNGTMIDDMDFHIRAWYDILNGLGAKISMEQTKAECYGKNDELLERTFPGRFSAAEKTKMSYAKETAYQETFRPSLALLPGLDAFLSAAAEKKIAMAIGSAAIRFNIDFVLDGLSIRHYFPVIVAAEDVRLSKPDPETYLSCAAQLGVANADCIVFEDSPKGVQAAERAGMQSVVLTTLHTPDEFSHCNNVLFFVKDYLDPQLNNIL
ncbi:MAG: HAD family phosphatase [Bacteroidota bacterium]|nr:HAD family phosphatase [Bacteroidota bacterium]